MSLVCFLGTPSGLSSLSLCRHRNHSDNHTAVMTHHIIVSQAAAVKRSGAAAVIRRDEFGTAPAAVEFQHA